jgi:hypothetical protein
MTHPQALENGDHMRVMKTLSNERTRNTSSCPNTNIKMQILFRQKLAKDQWNLYSKEHVPYEN